MGARGARRSASVHSLVASRDTLACGGKAHSTRSEAVKRSRERVTPLNVSLCDRFEQGDGNRTSPADAPVLPV
jgi:hypothetical protein